ncbi:hypothetical protein [Pseudoalteromonas rubra]|uniref:hypothetical protein n=1 Tax=Pseudoalteromonas rubra TaxID=43658 RepID=UPI002DBCE60A|nr:hypothetical protein [Pseudoalteromonas rubra]MEC4091849.1 hypothetical protein [Pseudoalteromonas rubra]
MSKVVDVIDELNPFSDLTDKIWDETIGALLDSLSPDAPQEDIATLAKGLQKGIDQPRRITFGRDRVGGVIAHQATVERDEKQWVQLIVLINGAPIDALEDIYIANKPLSDYPADSYNYSLSDGRHTTANSMAVSEMAGWTDKHIGFNQAHVFIELENNREVFPDGISDCEFLIRGIRVWDPRDGGQNPDDESTWQWSQNAVLCALHYVRFYGAHQVPMHTIPLNWWIAAANVADEDAEFTGVDGNTMTEPRYTCNGTFQFTSRPSEVLSQLEKTFAGKIFRQMGQWFVRVGAWYGNPTYTIGPADVMGNVKIKWHADLRDRANTVRAQFVDPDQHYERTDAPPVVAEGYIAKDNQPLETSISLPFVRSVTTAQRLAKIHLEQTRLGVIELPLRHTALRAAVGRTIYVDLPREHISKKIYRVVDRKFRLTGGITLVCIEDGPLLWADDLVPGAVDITPNSDYVIGKPGPVFDVRVEVDGDGNGIIKWGHATPLAVHEYDVIFYDGDNRVYRDAVTYTQITVPKLALGTYSVRVYARNIFGQRSTSVTTQFSVLQPIAPLVSVDVDYNQVTLTAALPAVGIGTQFQWEFLGSAESPASGQRVFAQVYNRIGLQPLTTYLFRVRSVNHLGNSEWVNVSATTATVDLTEFINEIPLNKLSQEAQDLIADINQQVDRLRPETDNNLPSLVAKNIDQIQGLQDVTAILDDSLANGLPNQVRLANIKLDETALALTDMQRAVFDVTGNYTSFRQEYERRALANERLIDAIVYVDPDNGTIVNRAYQYTDSLFTLAQAHINGVDARVSFEARRLTQTQDRLTEATSQIMVQAGQINQRATYTEVDAQIAGAIAALTPAYSWQFNTSDEGFTGHSSYNAQGYLVCSNSLMSPAIEYSANQNPVFRLRVRKHANSHWVGRVYFGGAQPIPLPEPTSNDWEVVQVDATGTAGYAGTITGLTFELGACDVDYIEVGKRGANDLALRDVTARTTTIEQELDAGTGRMAQYATTAWTNAQGYQTQSNVQAALDSFNTTYGISAVLQQLADNDVIVKANAAQTWIDGANATIKDQVTQLLNEDGGVNQKLATAEQQLDAIAGEISQTVTQVQGLQLDLADKTLNEVLSEYNTLLRNNELAELGVTLAHANSKLSAVTDEVSAVAEQTTQLIAMQNQSAAGVTALGRAYANERQASVEREQRLRAEITTESGKAVAQAIDFTRAVTGYCVDADGNQVDEQDAVACEVAGHTWINGPVVERSMMLATAMVDARGYQTSNHVTTAINTFNAEYGITAALQTLTDNNTLAKANHASSWIAAADGYIRDQITIYNNADGGVNDHFAHVDQTLDAIAGEISRNVVQVQGMQLADQAQSLNDVIAAYNQLMQSNDLAKQDVKLSLAQDQLSAVTEELASTASYTLELGALHHQSQAYITTLASAFANEVRASVTRDERFAAFVGDTQAAFSDVTEAFAEVDAANIIRDQAFSAFAANTEAAFQSVTETLASQEQALVKQRTDLVAKIEQDDTATLASAITYTRAAVGYCIDSAGNITNETDAVQCVTDGHSWVDGPLAEYIRNLAITNADGQAVSIADIRQAFETQDGQLIARGGWVINNQGRIVSIAGYNDGDVGSIDLSADVIRQGVMIGETFVPTSYVDNTDPDNPVHVFRGRLELGDYTVNSVDDIRAQDGQRGPQGVPGEPGADGQSLYTWIAYSDYADGRSMYQVPTGQTMYIGIAVNKSTAMESSNPADYTWSLFKGPQGEQGLQGLAGEPGADGRTTYTWVKYAHSHTGSGMDDYPDGRDYIGLAYNKITPVESTNPADYTWSKLRGEPGADGRDGTDGVPGEPGADGQTLYTWIVYSDYPHGGDMYQLPSAATMYIGIAVNKTTPTESSNPSDYTWSLFKGPQGVPGEPGADGHTTYTWIKYAHSHTGSGMSDYPDGRDYIGLAYNKITPVESTNPADYTWSKLRGEPGADGQDGQMGPVGARGAGQFTVGTDSGNWSDAIANAACTGGTPVPNDVVTIYQISAPSNQTTKYWTGSFWQPFTLHLHGSALIDGTVFANGLVSATGTFDSISAVSGYVKINSEGIEARRISSYARFVTAPGQSAADNPATLHINGNSGTIGNLSIYNPSSSGYGATIYTNGTYALYASRGLIGPFTGAHDGLVEKSVHMEPGDLVRDIDLVNIADLSNAICTMGPTTQANDRAVRGVFVTRTTLTNRVAALRGYRGFERFIEYRDTHDVISFNALGEGVLNVCGQGGDIETGDYLCSSAIPGKAMRQADQNFERPYTIAQARHPITFTHPDQVKQAAVIYLRG